MSKKMILVLFVVLCLPLFVSGETIRVVSINVWSGLTYRGAIRNGEYEDGRARSFRHELLIKDLKELDADIISINEANMLPGYARDVAAELEYDFIYHVRRGGLRIGPVGFPLNLREGDTILAKEELGLSYLGRSKLSGGAAGNVFSMQTGDVTQIVGGLVSVGGRKVYVFTTHWHKSEFAYRDNMVGFIDAFEQEHISESTLLDALRNAIEGKKRRLKDAADTVEYINGIAGEAPIILAGSFEALPGSEEIQLIKDAGFIDTFAVVGKGPGYTYDEKGNTNIAEYYLNEKNDWKDPRQDRLDYIFVRGDTILALNSRTVFTTATYGVHPSDHYGVLTEISIEPKPSEE
jgi:endonuclease/exonuclease/phosphatase family metal-dependent hydrolase